MKRLEGQDALARIHSLIAAPSPKSPYSSQFLTWRLNCLRVISQIDGEQSSTYRVFDEIDFEANDIGGSEIDDQSFSENFSECYNKSIAILQSVQEAVLEDINLEFQRSSSKPNPAPKSTPTVTGNQIFVVHGHDEKLKLHVARFIEKLGLQPIILHEQADRGQTIIEKFEKHSDVSFAVVLLTPDDEGRKSPESHWTDTFLAEEPPLLPRARQNVMFEFGYFIGKLGRANVCGLYCEGVELPSDYSGVLYTKVDDGGAWQLKLVKELKDAGFAVDANRLT